MRAKHAEQVIQIVLADVRAEALRAAIAECEMFAITQRNEANQFDGEQERTASDKYDAAMEIMDMIEKLIDAPGPHDG